MHRVILSTPLFALDAVAMDTETTGLDARTARIVEIGAVPLVHGRLDKAHAFETLVRIDAPVPAAAVKVHGIDAEALTGAPDFAAAYSAFQAFAEGRVIVGHTLGFDLALLKRECTLADIPWDPPVALDTRMLAQIANPDLAGFSLETLAEWLGLPLDGRHRALADARLTGKIFTRLVPHLRARNIRTLGEAAQACAGLTEVLDQYHRSGWSEPSAAPARRDAEATLARIDSYPYRHRVRDVMSAPPLFVGGAARLRDVLSVLMTRRISSVFVADDGDGLAETGIVTERDLLRTVASDGPEALEQTAGEIASRPLVSVPAGDFVYRAIGRMDNGRIRHLAVVSDEGEIVGALSARDLLRLRASAAITLGDDIDRAPDVVALARIWARLPVMAASLIEEEVGARAIAAVIARELGVLTRRAGLLAEERMLADGAGAAPCSYALLVLGSAGRGESLLAMDQDNAIVFTMGEPDGPEDRWFARLGQHLADILNEVGVPYCKGGVMASQPAFRGSLQTWRERFSLWVRRSRPDDLLNVDIVFDFACVHGDAAMAATLWREAWAGARHANHFLKLLAEGHAAGDGALGFFGNLRSEAGRIDLKRQALHSIVAGARILALRFGTPAHATVDRLAMVRALDAGGGDDLAALDAIHERILALILRSQIADIHAGLPPSNKVPLALIESHGGTALLKADLKRIHTLDTLVRDLLASSSRG